jgi:drug/metabolite transporter (DMT)-like permease
MIESRSGMFMAMFAAIAVGSSVAVSAKVAGYPWLVGLSIRYGCAAVVLALIVRTRRQAWPRMNCRDVGLLVLLAATGMVGFNVFLIAAVQHADPGAVGAIVGSVPLVLAVLGPLQAGRSPTRRALLAAAVVVVGAALAEGAGSASPLGVLLALGALGGEAAFSLLAAPLLPRLGPMFVATFACALASAMALAGGIVIDGGGALRAPRLSEGLSLLYLGVIVSGLGAFAWYSAIVRLGVDRTGLFAGLMPVFALLTGWLVVSGNPSLVQFSGAAIVGAGVSFGISRRVSIEPTGLASSAAERSSKPGDAAYFAAPGTINGGSSGATSPVASPNTRANQTT